MKRLVLEHPDGTYRIVAAVEYPKGLPEAIVWEEEPYTMVKVTPRAVYFKPIMELPSGRFGDFHPSQV